MPNRRDDDCIFWRISCGVIGFILFFLIAFISFIVAEEPEEQYEPAMFLGFAMLLPTCLFFCCVLKESKRIEIIEEFPSQHQPLLPNEPQPVEPQPEPPIEQAGAVQDAPPPAPFWRNPSKISLKYIRSFWPLSGSRNEADADDTTEDENDPDPDMQKLVRMTKGGGYKQLMGESSKKSEDEDSAGIQMLSLEAGPSNVAGRKSNVAESIFAADLELQSSKAGPSNAAGRKSNVAETSFAADLELQSSKAGPSNVAGRKSNIAESSFAADLELQSSKAGPSKSPTKKSEVIKSISGDSPMEEIAAVSSDSAKQSTESSGAEQASAEVSKLSLMDPDKSCPDLMYMDE